MPAVSHSAARSMAFSMMIRPIGTIRPDFSAIGMNSPGETTPRSGWIHRTRASTPVTRPSRSETCGWK